MNVVQTPHSRVLKVPVFGNSADIYPGSMLMAGVTAETDLGVAIANTAASNLDAIGVLTELHDYSESGDALVAGSAYWGAEFNSGKAEKPVRPVSLLDTAVLARVDYDLTSYVAVTGQTTVTITVGSLENNIDTSYLYTGVGTGLGQLFFIVTSGSGTCTVYSAPTVSLSTDTYVVKILRLFHTLVVWTAPSATAETKLGTTAAAGTGRAVILDNHIVRNGLDVSLDPKVHHNLQSLTSISDLKFYSLLSVSSTVFHRLS